MKATPEREARELWKELSGKTLIEWSTAGRARFEKWMKKFSAASPETRILVFRSAADGAVRALRKCDEISSREGSISFDAPCHMHNANMSEVVLSCLEGELPWTDADLSELIRWWADGQAEWGTNRTGAAKKMLRCFVRIGALDKPVIRTWLRTAADRERAAHKPDQTFVRKAEEMLGQEARLQLGAGEVWSDAMQADIAALASKAGRAWNELTLHASTARGSSPSKTWTKTATRLAEAVGRDEIVRRFETWLPLTDKPRTLAIRNSEWRGYAAGSIELIDAGQDVLKGLCWIAAALEEARLARTLGRLALSSFRKVPGIGPRAVRVGNAAIFALGCMEGADALGQLAMLRVKVKFGGGVKALEKALTAASERAGMSREDVDELGVPTYGFTDVGVRRETLGDVTATLVLRSTGKSELTFSSAKGKSTKTAPAAVKAAHAEALAELKLAAKDAAAMLSAQRDRLDGLYLQSKSWPMREWRERYLDHPLVGILARNLVWNVVDEDGRTRSVVHRADQGFVDARDKPVEIVEEDATVRPWHPIESTMEDALAWRHFFEEHDIVQPFKQAHREIYLLTDAERTTRTYSNRFAAHVLRQHQFNALCAARGWRNKLRMMVDDSYPPATRILARHGLRAEYWIEGAGDEYGRDTNEAGAYLYLTTDQVRFYPLDAPPNHAHAGGGGYEVNARATEAVDPIHLESIPALVLSEILRDVDLFVGVASVGANPEWQDGGPENRHRTYWWEFGFGELSQTGVGRKELLQRLIPRLSIASLCTFDDRYLVVQGKLRRYRIHLGSGNILMEPNDQYLCIVPRSEMTAASGGIRLPFEGDRTLSIVLSKALLLAADDEITDPSILQQIRG